MFQEREFEESEYCYGCNCFRINYDNIELVCPQCGECSQIIFNNLLYSSPKYTNETTSSFGSQPRNFRIFDNFLLSIQGLKCYETSQEKLKEITDFFEDEGLSISKKNIKEFLHRQKRYGMYNRINNIYYALTNHKPPQLSGLLSFSVKMNYVQLTNQFLNKPRRRKIFLENGYIIYKLLQMKGENETAKKLIPFQKKFLTNDKLFKELCEELGWTFVPTEPY